MNNEIKDIVDINPHNHDNNNVNIPIDNQKTIPTEGQLCNDVGDVSPTVRSGVDASSDPITSSSTSEKELDKEINGPSSQNTINNTVIHEDKPERGNNGAQVPNISNAEGLDHSINVTNQSTVDSTSSTPSSDDLTVVKSTDQSGTATEPSSDAVVPPTDHVIPSGVVDTGGPVSTTDQSDAVVESSIIDASMTNSVDRSPTDDQSSSKVVVDGPNIVVLVEPSHHPPPTSVDVTDSSSVPSSTVGDYTISVSSVETTPVVNLDSPSQVVPINDSTNNTSTTTTNLNDELLKTSDVGATDVLHVPITSTSSPSSTTPSSDTSSIQPSSSEIPIGDASASVSVPSSASASASTSTSVNTNENMVNPLILSGSHDASSSSSSSLSSSTPNDQPVPLTKVDLTKTNSDRGSSTRKRASKSMSDYTTGPKYTLPTTTESPSSSSSTSTSTSTSMSTSSTSSTSSSSTVKTPSKPTSAFMNISTPLPTVPQSPDASSSGTSPTMITTTTSSSTTKGGGFHSVASESRKRKKSLFKSNNNKDDDEPDNGGIIEVKRSGGSSSSGSSNLFPPPSSTSTSSSSSSTSGRSRSKSSSSSSKSSKDKKDTDSYNNNNGSSLSSSGDGSQEPTFLSLLKQTSTPSLINIHTSIQSKKNEPTSLSSLFSKVKNTFAKQHDHHHHQSKISSDESNTDSSGGSGGGGSQDKLEKSEKNKLGSVLKIRKISTSSSGKSTMTPSRSSSNTSLNTIGTQTPTTHTSQPTNGGGGGVGVGVSGTSTETPIRSKSSNSVPSSNVTHTPLSTSKPNKEENSVKSMIRSTSKSYLNGETQTPIRSSSGNNISQPTATSTTTTTATSNNSSTTTSTTTATATTTAASSDYPQQTPVRALSLQHRNNKRDADSYQTPINTKYSTTKPEKSTNRKRSSSSSTSSTSKLSSSSIDSKNLSPLSTSDLSPTNRQTPITTPFLHKFKDPSPVSSPTTLVTKEMMTKSMTSALPTLKKSDVFNIRKIKRSKSMDDAITYIKKFEKQRLDADDDVVNDVDDTSLSTSTTTTATATSSPSTSTTMKSTTNAAKMIQAHFKRRLSVDSMADIAKARAKKADGDSKSEQKNLKELGYKLFFEGNKLEENIFQKPNPFIQIVSYVTHEYFYHGQSYHGYHITQQYDIADPYQTIPRTYERKHILSSNPQQPHQPVRQPQYSMPTTDEDDEDKGSDWKRVIFARSEVIKKTSHPQWRGLDLKPNLFLSAEVTYVDIEVKSWCSDGFHFLIGSTGPIPVSDLLFSKPGKELPLKLRSVKKKKTKKEDNPLFYPHKKIKSVGSLTLTRSVPTNYTRSRFYTVIISFKLHKPSLLGTRSPFLKIYGRPQRTLRDGTIVQQSSKTIISKTETQDHVLSGTFEPIILDIQLCGSYHNKLKIEAHSYNSDGSTMFIGEVLTTMLEMQQTGFKFPIINYDKRENDLTYENSGVLSIDGASPLKIEDYEEPNTFNFKAKATKMKGSFDAVFFVILAYPLLPESYPHHPDFKSLSERKSKLYNTLSNRQLKKSLIYKSAVIPPNIGCEWNFSLSTGLCGGMDKEISVSFFSHSSKTGANTMIGGFKSSLREFTLTNSLFQIIDKEKQLSNSKYVHSGLFAIIDKSGHYEKPQPPQNNGYTVKARITNCDSKFAQWIETKGIPYVNPRLGTHTATAKGSLECTWNFTYEEYGGLDSFVTFDLIKEKKVGVTESVCTTSITLREMSFVYHSLNIFQMTYKQKKKKTAPILEILEIKPIPMSTSTPTSSTSRSRSSSRNKSPI
eukprot:TRINITY_DN4121_c0_g1_i1.p1 TRINITY_DN4121_c0_g1~~TRINITY_DN4121_c0_g1_i1.p1  ORF type:complete len:1792 (-),score=640.38 TRINITY_DN4121_c0_g1_i1:160-5490(-)